MSLRVIYDNNPLDPRLRTDWGFAAWLDYGEHTVLFDTGGNGSLLLGNMAALGLDLQQIDVVVLSHAHGDHTGGLSAVLAENPRVTVYVPQAFPSSFKSRVRDSGATLVEVSDPVEILPGLWSTGQMGTHITEQALVVQTTQGLVVVTGCAHPGVVQMVARAAQVGQDEIRLVLGGFHLGEASQEDLTTIVEEFRRLGVEQVGPCHCSGDKARELFRRAYGADFHTVGAGWQFTASLLRPAATEGWGESRPGETIAWQPASQGIPAQVGVAAVGVAPSDPRTVYLVAYEPGGLYRSADGGISWQATSGDLASLAPLSIAVHPANPEVAWIGTMTGGYQTSDGGRTWGQGAGLPQEPIYAVAVSPDGRTVYAGGEATGVWHTRDGGQSWQTGESPQPGDSILSLAVAPDGAVFAGTSGQGVWVSRDGVAAWVPTGAGLETAHVPILQVLQDRRLYALADSELQLSRDGGETWQPVGPPGFESLSFAAEPVPGHHLYLGSKGRGLAVSPDGAETWTFFGGALRHADITCLAAGRGGPAHAYVGTRYNGLYRTTNGGADWTLISGALGQPVVTALAQHPSEPDVFYAGTLDGVYRSDDRGGGWRLVSGEMGRLSIQGLAVSPTAVRVYAGTQTGMFVSKDGGEAWQWAEDDTGGIAVFNVVVDPHDVDRVYAGSWGHNVLRSNDGGRTWAPIHHGLETLSVHAFTVDPTASQRLYAGTVEAVYRSTDGGESWHRTSLVDRPLTTFALLVDPASPTSVYAGTTEGVYHSADGGQTWHRGGGESLTATVTVLALDWASSQILYAGTEHHGLFRTADGGQTWEPWGLERTSVYAILVDRSGTIWLGTNQGIFRGEWSAGHGGTGDSQSEPVHPGRPAGEGWTGSRWC